MRAPEAGTRGRQAESTVESERLKQAVKRWGRSDARQRFPSSLPHAVHARLSLTVPNDSSSQPLPSPHLAAVALDEQLPHAAVGDGDGGQPAAPAAPQLLVVLGRAAQVVGGGKGLQNRMDGANNLRQEPSGSTIGRAGRHRAGQLWAADGPFLDNLDARDAAPALFDAAASLEARAALVTTTSVLERGPPAPAPRAPRRRAAARGWTGRRGAPWARAARRSRRATHAPGCRCTPPRLCPAAGVGRGCKASSWMLFLQCTCLGACQAVRWRSMCPTHSIRGPCNFGNATRGCRDRKASCATQALALCPGAVAQRRQRACATAFPGPACLVGLAEGDDEG